MEYSVANLSDFGEKSVVAVRVGLQRIVLFRLPDGSISALEDRCSHADVRLSGGTFDDGIVECPAHGARFDARTGSPLCMPAVTPVKSYPVRIVDEKVLVEV